MDNMTLKQLALEETLNIPTPDMESEIPSPKDENVLMIGGTPVVVNKPVNKPVMSAPAEAEIAEMMKSATSPITPSTMGLSDDIFSKKDIPEMIRQDIGTLSTKKTSIEVDRSDLIEKLNEIGKEMPEAMRNEFITKNIASLDEIEKDLVINMGLTILEARTAAENRVIKQFSDEYNSWKENAVIVIDKSADINDLGLTAEEHRKLEKVKRVRLVAVEDVELANIKIETPNEKFKADYIKSIEGTISKYSVPIPIMGDFVGFKGAQILQMINLINYEDSKPDELISMKASLIYDKIINGSILKKYDNEGRIIMSYNEFINKFPYLDIDLALYGILCASSMEENSTVRVCENCNHEWNEKYNVKALLDLSEITDAFKERIDTVLENKSNEDELKMLYKDMRKSRRYRSPFSGNIYDLSYPSIARALNIVRRINIEDLAMNYLAIVVMHLSRVLIYNSAKNTYVEVTSEETNLMIDTVKALINEDMQLISEQLRNEFIYTPRFTLHAVCPSCGHDNVAHPVVDSLIFWKAQDSTVEIDN